MLIQFLIVSGKSPSPTTRISCQDSLRCNPQGIVHVRQVVQLLQSQQHLMDEVQHRAMTLRMELILMKRNRPLIRMSTMQSLKTVASILPPEGEAEAETAILIHHPRLHLRMWLRGKISPQGDSNPKVVFFKSFSMISFGEIKESPLELKWIRYVTLFNMVLITI